MLDCKEYDHQSIYELHNNAVKDHILYMWGSRTSNRAQGYFLCYKYLRIKPDLGQNVF